jgi:hypothetical protein
MEKKRSSIMSQPFFGPIHTAYIKATHIRLVHMNKLSLWLNCRTVRIVFFPFLVFPFYLMADVQYPARQGAPAQAALPVAQGIQPADELAAQAAGGQVAQVVQQVVGQDALPAAEHVAQEIQPAAPQVPQQAVGQVQHGELEVEYVYFCRLCVFFYQLRAGTRAATLYLSFLLLVFGFPAHSLLAL